MKPKNKMCSPNDCSCDELRQFEELVIKGGEVCKNGLAGRIKKARLLAFYHLDGKLIATAAIKKPEKSHKNRVFCNAKTLCKPEDFNLEFGWAFTKEGHRGKGFCSDLVRQLMSNVNEPIFATSRVDNEKMQKILERNDFRKDGNPYQGCSSELFLYVKK